MTEARDFWTRRRAAVAAEAGVESAIKPTDEDATEAARLEGLSDAELLQEFDLPEPETLKSGDDFTVFLSQSVPARLRRRALRALWRTNPALANVDGLVDYGADYTDSATVVENLQTAYTVGRGMLAHLERLARSELPEPDPGPDPEPKATSIEGDEDPEPDEVMCGTREHADRGG